MLQTKNNNLRHHDSCQKEQKKRGKKTKKLGLLMRGKRGKTGIAMNLCDALVSKQVGFVWH